MKSDARKYFFTALKILAGIALALVLYFRLRADMSKFDPALLAATFQQTRTILLLLAALLLMPVNWLLESLKWKLMINSALEKISLYTAFRSVLAGVAFGNLAPGRATEFAGKIIFISEGNRLAASFLHFINGASQLVVTILFGVLALSSGNLLQASGLPSSAILLISAGCWILSAVLLLFFFNPSYAFNRLKKIKLFRKYANLDITVSRGTLLAIFFLSVIRYLVFSLQFYLVILCFFSPDAQPGRIAEGIFGYYLLVSVIPMFSAAEAFIRGGIGIVIFSQAGQSSMNIFVSSTLLWIINIVLPSLAGYIFFLFRKLKPAKPERK